MRWLLATVLSGACFFAAAFGTFRPIRRVSGPQYEYLFVWPGAPAVWIVAAMSAAALGALYVGVLVATRRLAPHNLGAARSGRWLAPLSALGGVALGLLPAVPGIGERGAAAGYFFYDLRWWWAAALTACVLWRIDRLLDAPVGRRVRHVAAWPPTARLLALDALLFSIVVGWAVVTTPLLRFGGGLHGDEPKYIRYCETWYQGGGCDVSRKERFADLPLDAPSAVLANVGLLASAVGDEIQALAADVRGFVAHPRGFRWNRATGRGGFLTSKRGTGVYQLHQPGLSAFLFPGYFVDRHFLGMQSGYQGEFPAELVMTNLTMLVLLGVSAVALFRLLRRALDSESLAWLASALAMLTLPMTAFAFQFYPEVPALLLIVMAANYVWFPRLTPRAALRTIGMAVFAGAAAGMLTWLHPRFLVVSIVLAGVGAVRTSGTTRRAFVAGYAAVLFSLLAFIYHVTGSWLPNALYQASEGDVAISMSPSGILSNLMAYAFHGTWGLLPHAPWLLGVLPGLVVLGRRTLTGAAFVAGVALALGIPAAGHGLIAAGGTPGRFLLAVVPLLVWPAAVLVQRFWASAGVRAATILAAILSLDAARAYNWSHDKGFGPIRDASLSGWKPNLAFPEIRGDFWNPSQPAYFLLVACVGLVAALTVVAFLRSRGEPREPARAVRSSWWVTVALILIVVGWSTVATAARGRWTRREYLVDDARSRRDAAIALVALDRCRVCFTSERSQVDWTWLEPNPGRAPQIDVGIADRTLTVDVSFASDGDLAGFGRVQVDFGDGEVTAWQGVVGRRAITHEYRQAGEYRLVVWQHLRDGPRVDRRTIKVDGGR